MGHCEHIVMPHSSLNGVPTINTPRPRVFLVGAQVISWWEKVKRRACHLTTTSRQSIVVFWFNRY